MRGDCSQLELLEPLAVRTVLLVVCDDGELLNPAVRLNDPQ